MAYKSLLTITTDKDTCGAALTRAIDLARAGDSHLDVQCLGIDRTQMGYYYGGANVLIQQDALQTAQKAAEELEAEIRAQLKAEDISWACETVVTQMVGVTRVVTHRARFSDLVVLPKPYGEGCGQEHEVIIEAAMFEGNAPVLVIPPDNKAPIAPRRVTIAWNESAESLSAVRSALPMLQAADFVNIAVIDPPTHGPDRSDPGGALSQMLARQGVTAEISVLAKTMPRVADVLTRHVRDLDAELLVMGAYGHSRFREAILGGATRDMLEMAEVPVLMAH